MKIAPYILSTLVGVGLYLVSINQQEDFKSLLLNIAATFLAIPLIYLVFDLSKKESQKKLRHEIMDYAKLQVDTEVISNIKQLQKMTLGINKNDFSISGITKFIEMSNQEIANSILTGDFIAFQLIKQWDFQEKKLEDILKNPFILGKLDDDNIIAIIEILKSIRRMNGLRKLSNLFVVSNEKINNDYVVERSGDANLPDRFLLLKILENDEFCVEDFGDIDQHNANILLCRSSINPLYFDIYVDAIVGILETTRTWLKLTGMELIVDSRIFRIKLKPYAHQRI